MKNRKYIIYLKYGTHCITSWCRHHKFFQSSDAVSKIRPPFTRISQKARSAVRTVSISSSRSWSWPLDHRRCTRSGNVESLLLSNHGSKGWNLGCGYWPTFTHFKALMPPCPFRWIGGPTNNAVNGAPQETSDDWSLASSCQGKLVDSHIHVGPVGIFILWGQPSDSGAAINPFKFSLLLSAKYQTLIS